MALTDTFVKNVKHTGAPSGDKHTDGAAMYLLVNTGGKYWRMNYRFADKRKTLALGVYPAVTGQSILQQGESAEELPTTGWVQDTVKIKHQGFHASLIVT